jgi:phosphoribosylformylglycinamidine synthase
MPDKESLTKLSGNNQIAVRYIDPNNNSAINQDDVLPFPQSPNGSMMNIAGISDRTGLVFGLMPHPEAIYAQWLHPDFTRGAAPKTDSEIAWEGQGLQIFRNAVDYVKSIND